MKKNRTKSKQHVTSTPTPSSEPSTTNNNSPESRRKAFKVGQHVFYIDEDGESHKARINNIHDDDKMHTYYTIEVKGGTEVKDVHHAYLSVVDPIVDKVLGILNLRNDTDNYLREKYPTLKKFETFLELSFEVVKAKYKNNGTSKEPLFKRSDREEFIILSRWSKKNQVEGKIKWDNFNQKNFNDFREQALKDDLIKILEELGIDNDKVKNALKAKGVRTAAHFAQKPRSWYEKLCEEEPDTEQNRKQTKHLLNATEIYAIEKFKNWYNFHFIGYLPSDWIVPFQNDDVPTKERDLRKVLRVVGLNADAIEALKMNDIKDIATLNRMSEEWKTQDQRRGRCCGLFLEQRDEERARQWKDMGLVRNDARDIINFRHWYNFYVAGKKNMKGWTAEFNSAQYNNFLLLYQPGDDFKKPSWCWWKCCCCADSLNFSQERHDYYDMLERAAELGEVTDELRFHLLKYMEKREEMSLIEEINSHHKKGLGDSTQQENMLWGLLRRDVKNADKKDKTDLLFGQTFGQFFFSAFLVLVLLGSWAGTTGYFMKQYMRRVKEPDYETHPGFDYVIFIHNVLFGLVTAVVIQELGEEAKDTSLYHRFLPTYREQKRRQNEHRIVNSKARGNTVWDGFVCFCSGTVQWAITGLMFVILWSTRLYIIVWICFGAASLLFGAILGIDTSNPLYTTGQTWLGIAVTIGYTYFGLSAKKAPKKAAVQATIDGGSNGANGREEEEARFADWRDETRSSVVKTYYELTNDIDTYFGLNGKNALEEDVVQGTVQGTNDGATSAGNKENSSAPFSSGTTVQPTPTATGNSTAPSTPRKQEADEVTPDPPSFEDMKPLGPYKDEYGTTFEKYQATPDGNCLPYAVNGSNGFQKMIKTRNGAAHFIDLHRSYYDSVFDDTEEVIAQFRNEGTPLGHEFLQVFADWTGDTIILYVTGTRTRHTFTPSAEFESASPSGETRYVIYNNVDHHDGLRLTDNSSNEEADEDSGQEDDEGGDGDGDDLSKEEEEEGGVSGDDVEGKDEGNFSK